MRWFYFLVDPCVVPGCNAPYNIGCRVVDNEAQCLCPTCPNSLRPVCASDNVQDLSECHLKRQACQGNITVTVAKQGPCGTFFNYHNGICNVRFILPRVF